MRRDLYITSTCNTCCHGRWCLERDRRYPSRNYRQKETSTTSTPYNLPERGGDSVKRNDVHELGTH